jgi:hypothetical protein
MYCRLPATSGPVSDFHAMKNKILPVKYDIFGLLHTTSKKMIFSIKLNQLNPHHNFLESFNLLHQETCCPNYMIPIT